MTAGNYTIDASVTSNAYGVIRAHSNMKIEGELDANGTPTVVWTLMANAPTSVFGEQRGIIGIDSGSASNLEISGIKFNGNKDNQTVLHGKGYHNFFGGSQIDVSNLKIHDCYVHDSQGDGVRCGKSGGSNIEIYNFNVDRCGHDAIFLINASDIKIHDCKTILRANSCCRLWRCQNAEIWNLEGYTVSGVTAVSPGMEIHTNSGDTALLQNIRIHDCYIHGTYGPGLQIVNNTSNVSKDIYVYNCIFKGCGQMPASVTTINAVGGIIAEGVNNLQIFNNTFDACRGYAVGIINYDLSSTTSGNVVYVKNNIFINTATSLKTYTANGTAVANFRTTTHTVQSAYNCFFNNVLNYKNVSGSNDLTVDPLVFDSANADYHLKSTYGRWNGSAWVTDTVQSPCIDAGDPTSDYSKEPTDGNGGRVNIGNYGNTAQASKSLGGTTSGGILYVGFNEADSNIVCDGVDDNVQIQQALDTVRDNSLYHTVHLYPGIYDIALDLKVYSNTVLEGEAGTVLRLKDNAGWAALIPIINQGTGAGIHDVEIRNFEVDGNRANQSEADAAMYYNIIYWLYADNIKIHDMVLHDCKNDAIRFKYASDAEIWNNIIYEHGNIGIHVFESSYASIHDNTVKVRVEAGISVTDTNHATVYNNTVSGEDASDAGIAGIRVMHTKTIVMDDLQIYGNYIYDTYGPGLMLYNSGSGSADLTSACNLHIHHNMFKGCGLRDDIIHCGAITVQGWHNTLIENNDIDSCYRYGIVAIVGTNHVAPSGTGYAIEVKNNIISGILAGGLTPTGTGIGVANTLTSTHSINCHHNCVYSSAAANYLGVTPANDLNVDPLWYNPALDDYHLRSPYGRWNGFAWENDLITSPCIDAGDPLSSFSNEPEGNGARINIGRYGNTAEASRSASAPVWSDYFIVARESGFDYYCDGSADQIEINFALIAAGNSGTTKTVLLKSGTYVITDTINVPSGVTLAAEAGVIVLLAAGLSWGPNKPMVQVAASAANVRISSFTLDGNRDAYPSITSGAYYHNLIMAASCSGLTIDNMVLRNNHNDAVYLSSCTTVRYYNITVDRCGHDGLYCSNCSDVKAYNCTIQCRTNSGMRMYNTNHVEIYNNTIFSNGEGGAGIQLQQYGTGVMTDIVVRNNVIHHTNSSGMWLYGGAATAVSNTACEIYDNVFYDCGTRAVAGSFINGILAWGWNANIHHNIIDGSYGAGISVSFVSGYTAHSGSGYAVNIDSCIISMSRNPGNYYVQNSLSPSHVVSLTNSEIYACIGGSSGTISSTGVIFSDPEYTDRTNRDYTLLPSSPMYAAFQGHTPGLLSTTTPGDPGTTDPGTTDPGTTDPTPVSVGTEIIDGRTVIYAEYVPESSIGTTPTAPVMRSFPGDLTKIVISSGAEFDEFEILRAPSEGDRLSCGVAVKTVETMCTVKVHCKPSSLGLLPYAICASDTASYSAPGTSVWPCTIGIRIGAKYTSVKGCVLSEIKYEFDDIKKTADCVLTFLGIERKNWSTTDYASGGTHSTPPTSAPFTLASLSNVKYDGGTAEEKGFIIDSLSFGFKNTIAPIRSTSGIPGSKIVGWSYGAMEVPLTLGISLTDPAQQDSAQAGNAHTLSFSLGGKAFNFSGIKWGNDANIDADPGSKVGMSLDAAQKAVRVSFS